ncbi:MAG: SHOCT domain-containing protein [Burkholderiaceae bacterium]
MILLLGAVIAVVMLVLRWLGGASHGSAWHPLSPHRSALDILKERYARGEISQDEFEERRRVLGN